MTNRWLLALLALSVGACVCPPDRREMRAFASAQAYQDDIKRCEGFGDCDPLCIHLFRLDNDATVDRCRLVNVSDLGVNVQARVTYVNTCAADGDFVIDDDGYVIDDGSSSDDCSGYCSGDDDGGGYDDGSDTGDDGGGYDDGGDTGGGDDTGDTGDDGGDTGGGGDDGGDDGGDFKPAPHRAPAPQAHVIKR
jgi:hypothetical protein